MTDNELLELLRKDSEKGLEEAVRQYSKYVYKIAHARLGSLCPREDIEEAVSDVFVKFYYAGLKNGFEFISVKSALSLIAGRHCIDVFRKVTRRAETVPLDELIEILPDNSAPAGENTPLALAIDKLGEPDRSIFIQKYFLGRPTKTIAAALGMKPNTVDKRVSRGLVKLREILKGEEE